MAYTKLIAKSDRISIDGTDASNAFRRFGLSGEHSQEDVSGFSADGFDEFLPGSTTVTFSGEAFYTEESAALIYPLWANKTTFELQWQPNGLVNTSAKTYYANVKIFTFGPEDTRGSVSVMPFEARIADNLGLQSAAGT